MSTQSLRTGVSGLSANQTRLDVISNNISNSGTVGFKRGRATFSEVLGQEVPGASDGPNGESRTGRGVAVGSVSKNFEQGSIDQTGVKTDLALNGDGFFIASQGEGAGSQQRQLTRAGNFTFNQNGELVTNNGLNVQGWEVDDSGKAQTGQLQDVQFDPNAQSDAKFTSAADVGGNLSADAANGDTSSVSSVVYDENGTAHDVVVEFTKDTDPNDDSPGTTSDDDPNRWEYEVKTPDSDPLDLSGSPQSDGSIIFNTDGSVDTIDDDPNGPGGTDIGDGPSVNWKSNAVSSGPSGPKSLALDFSGLTQYSGSTTTKFQSQNGHSSGKLADFNITQKGKLQLNYTNNQKEDAYQLAIGDVNNPNGLEQQGDNLFTTTNSSGDLQLGRAGRDMQTSVESGSLESSNVELSDEFASLIEAQRSYQASSRVVTTADQVLQETVQLKR